MDIPSHLFIDGSFAEPQQRRSTRLTNPATEEVFAQVAAAGTADVEKAVTSAEKTWESTWRDLAPGKRTEILFNIARVLRENLEDLAQLETLHIGKPINDSRDEVGLAPALWAKGKKIERRWVGARLQRACPHPTSIC